MTEEEIYEDIKQNGELVMRTLNLSRAASIAQHTEKEVYFLEKASKIALQVLAKYPDTEAAFVVYVSGGTPMLQYYLREGEVEQALHYCMQMVLKMRLLTRRLYSERSCTIFTQMVCTLINVFLEAAKKYSLFDRYPNETAKMTRLLYEVLYILQDNLKKVNPASMLFTLTSSLMTSFEQFGASHDAAMSLDCLNGLVNQVADGIEAFIFEDD